MSTITTLTPDEHDALCDKFFNEVQNPAAQVVKDILSNFNVFIWGDYIASAEIFNYDNEPSLSPNDIARMEEAEMTWINDMLCDVIDEGTVPKTVEAGAHSSIKLTSSEKYPVEDGVVQTIQIILDSFDAYVMGDLVWNSSYFKHNLPNAWEYQMCQMEGWETSYE